jgi:hypothetical protein
MKSTAKSQTTTLSIQEERWLDGMPSKIYNNQCTPLVGELS